MSGADGLQGCSPPRARIHVVAFLFEDGGDGQQDVGFVIYNEDLGTR